MQMTHFTIYTICRISSPPNASLYLSLPPIPPLLSFHSVFLSICKLLSHTHSHCCLSTYLSASIFNSLRYHLYSSCLRHPGKLNFVFNIVEFPACSGRPAGRRGLCTGGLLDLISPMLVLPGNVESSSKTAVPKVITTVQRTAESGLCSVNSWRMFFSVLPLRWSKCSGVVAAVPDSQCRSELLQANTCQFLHTFLFSLSLNCQYDFLLCIF